MNKITAKSHPEIHAKFIKLAFDEYAFEIIDQEHHYSDIMI